MVRRVFSVTSGRLAVYDWDAGRLADPLTFGAEEDGLTQFSAYLEHYPDDPVYMLVDVVEEEFREETIPHVIGFDRKSLLRTRLNRLFRDATYSHAIFLGRESDGRRDDRMLFTALIRPDLLAPWVGQIAKHKVPLAGIYSLPVLSAALLKPLGVGMGEALLVTMQSSGALRQTFFSGGGLKLSRLAVMPNVERRSQASYVLGEIEKLRRYLNSLRLLPQDSPLDVHILGAGELLADVARHSPDSITIRHHAVPIEEFARKVGVKGRYRSPYADRMFAHVLARRPPPNQYAPASQTRYFAMHQARRWLNVASIAVLFVSLMWGASRTIDGVVASNEASTVQRQAAFYEERYRIARERLPATPAESREMKNAVEMVGTIAAYRAAPLGMMVAVSEGLREFPSLQLERFDWLASTDAQAPVRGSARRRQSGVAALLGAGPDPSTSSNLYQLALIKGRIDPFNGDYRGALGLISRFAERLRGLDGVSDVQVVSLPLDIGSENQLAGDASVEASVGSAPFALRIVLKEKRDDAG